MPVAWRVVKKKQADTAFDGEGASKYGGRWNSPGTSVVYASETTALALLEILVHADGSLLKHYTATPVSFDDTLVTMIDPSVLPDRWRSHPGPFDLRRIGDEWVKSGKSAVLKVPSAIIPHESNYLLSTEHPGFKRMKIGDSLDLHVDLRLLGS